MISNIQRALAWGLLVLTASQAASQARAELALSHLIVQLQPGQKSREDIEVLNNSTERAYVAIEPSEIIDAGKPAQRRLQEKDPERRGLLVTPGRMILEPGQRKLLRLSSLIPANAQERVYRVTVKPVAGDLQSASTGLKILVGYDVLVLVRPTNVHSKLRAERLGSELRIKNMGNASVELVDGRQCDKDMGSCKELTGKRLYAGAEWSQEMSSSGPVEYTVVSAEKSSRQSF